MTDEVARARAKWAYRGARRPAFAEPAESGRESVWDFPRPPRVEAVAVAMRVEYAGTVIAATQRGLRVLETAGAPTYYFPPSDVELGRLEAVGPISLCEWKGAATNYALADHPLADCSLADLGAVAWSYYEPFAEYVMIAGWFAFHPSALACFLNDERVSPQPGGYYGGWVSADLAGPIKGGPGTEHW